MGTKLVAENPVSGVKPVRLPDAAPVYLEEHEITAFLDAAASYDEWRRPRQKLGTLLHDIFITYLKTGMRLEELRHLEWSDVDLNRGEISIRATKTVKSTSTMKLPSDVAAALRDLSADDFNKMDVAARQRLLRKLRLKESTLQRLQYSHFDLQNTRLKREVSVAWQPKSTGRVIPVSEGLRQVLARQQRKDNLVFSDPESGGLSRLKINRLVQRCARHAGITKPIHTHSLRHTFATQLRRQGVALETLQKLLGHADIRDTLIYAHFSPAEAKAAIPKIDFF